MINHYINISSKKEEKNIELISYYFRNKLEKQDYITFLENLVLYIKEKLIYIEYLNEIEDDIV
jgi:hypothetical protein